MNATRRWRFGTLRAWLRPANRYPLDRWVAREGTRLEGLVLNVGAGLDTRVFGSRVVRLDRFAPAPTVRADVTSTLPFTDGSFDGAVCSELLEHVADPHGLLLEIARVMRPGGRVIVTVPFVFHYHEDPADFRRYTPPGLRAALENAGFEVELAAGLGNKVTALFLLAEAVHPVAKVVVRTLLLPLGPLSASSRPRGERWSDWAPNAVALGRRR